MKPIKLNLGYVSLMLVLTSEISCYLQASQCQRVRQKSENQLCKFDDDYSMLNRFHVDVGVATSHNKSLVTSSVCRNVSLSQEFVCDSNDLKELPPVDQFPKNLTRFFLNATKVQFNQKSWTCKNLFAVGILIMNAYYNSNVGVSESHA